MPALRTALCLFAVAACVASCASPARSQPRTAKPVQFAKPVARVPRTNAPDPAGLSEPSARGVTSLDVLASFDDDERAQVELVGALVRHGVGSLGMRASRADTLSPRNQVDPTTFRVADLPMARLPEPLTTAEPPEMLSAGGDPPDLVIDMRRADRAAVARGFVTVRVGVQGEAVGRIRVGTSEASLLGPDSGVHMTCGGTSGSRRTIVPARWETVSRSGDGLLYTVTDAWFDMATCRAQLVARASVQAKLLASDLLFAFRTCSGAGNACTDESITFIGPPASMVSATTMEDTPTSRAGAFSLVTLPVKRGGAGAFVERVSVGALEPWRQLTGAKAKFVRDVVLGADIVQGVEDAEPIAIAYASETR